MALEYKFHHSENFLRNVQLLKESISIRGIVSQFIRYQMKILMDERPNINKDKKKKILKIINDKRRSKQLIEDLGEIESEKLYKGRIRRPKPLDQRE